MPKSTAWLGDDQIVSCEVRRGAARCREQYGVPREHVFSKGLKSEALSPSLSSSSVTRGLSRWSEPGAWPPLSLRPASGGRACAGYGRWMRGAEALHASRRVGVERPRRARGPAQNHPHRLVGEAVRKGEVWVAGGGACLQLYVDHCVWALVPGTRSVATVYV
eukprot:5303862-Pleurochrysis_carterae.AAC.2